MLARLRRHLREHRLRFRLLLYILAVSSVFTLIGTGIQLYWEFRTEIRSLNDLLQQIEESHLEGLVASQWLLDEHQTRAQLNGILGLKEVLFVELQPADGTETLALGSRSTEHFTERSYSLVREHRSQNVDLGTLTVMVSTEGIYQRLRDKILIILGIQAIKTFATSTFILFVVQALVTRPLLSLGAHARRLSLNQLDEPLELERGRHHREDELDRLAEDLEEMRKRLASDLAILRSAEEEKRRLIADLEEKNAEMARFNYTISHDLKNPLVTIKNFLGLMQRDLETGRLERLEQDIAHMDRAASRLRRLLDELFELSRIGMQSLRFERVNLVELIEETLRSLEPLVEERAARVRVAEAFPEVEGDIDRLREVLRHLLENAVSHHPPGTPPDVELGWQRQPGELVIFVRDRGLGIEPRFHEKIFEIFERLDPESSDGTGIGLTLVQRIVETHGGRIWVESEGRGQGSTFYFTLPAESSAPT